MTNPSRASPELDDAFLSDCDADCTQTSRPVSDSHVEVRSVEPTQNALVVVAHLEPRNADRCVIVCSLRVPGRPQLRPVDAVVDEERKRATRLARLLPPRKAPRTPTPSPVSIDP